MYLLQIQFSLTDIIVLQIMALVLGFITHFALVNKRRLQMLIEESQKAVSLTGTGGRYADDLKPVAQPAQQKIPAFWTPLPFMRRARNAVLQQAPSSDAPEEVLHLKQSIRSQQKTLEQLLSRVDKLQPAEAALPYKAGLIATALEQKEAELQKTKQQLSAVQKVAGRVTEVYQEFDLLQQKLAELEESASKATRMAIDLNEMEQAYDQLKKDLARKQERLQESVSENEQLHLRLSNAEDKLGEANLQRQQLHKKVQLLENINGELQQMSDANQKLKTELRRIAELESLLSMVSDERDLLLKKRLS